MQLFDRRLEIILANDSGVDSFLFNTDFAIEANVDLSLDTPEPDRCKVRIFNLNKNTRTSISKESNRIRICAGYNLLCGELFLGDIIRVFHKYVGPDWITTILGGHESSNYKDSMMNKTFQKGTSLYEIIKDIAIALEVTKVEYIGDINWTNKKTSRGKSFISDAKLAMNEIAKDNNLFWTIQKGILVIANKNKSRENIASIISPETGLLSAPAIEELEEPNGFLVSCSALCNPELIPGNKAVIRSKSLEDETAISIWSSNFFLTSRDNSFSVFVEGKAI